MKSTIHLSKNRGNADHGWLNATHSFSFANYHNLNKMNFGALRVLNDDVIAPGMGFGTHPHDNMEIVTIMLKGDLQHKDSMGNQVVIHEGFVQVMSAGSGIQHSEVNYNKDKEVRLFQLWIFPKEKNITPRYDVTEIGFNKITNNLVKLAGAKNDDTAKTWINQDACISFGSINTDKILNYKKSYVTNGLYLMVIDGEIIVDSQILKTRDAIGIEDFDTLDIKSLKENSQLLFIEVPMVF